MILDLKSWSHGGCITRKHWLYSWSSDLFTLDWISGRMYSFTHKRHGLRSGGLLSRAFCTHATDTTGSNKGDGPIQPTAFSVESHLRFIPIVVYFCLFVVLFWLMRFASSMERNLFEYECANVLCFCPNKKNLSYGSSWLAPLPCGQTCLSMEYTWRDMSWQGDITDQNQLL